MFLALSPFFISAEGLTSTRYQYVLTVFFLMWMIKTSLKLFLVLNDESERVRSLRTPPGRGGADERIA